MTYNNNKPMFTVDETKLKQRLMGVMQNGCIVCIHNDTCDLPFHGKFKHGGPVCPDAEHVSPMEAFKIVWGPAFVPVNKQSTGRKRKGK